MKDGASGILGFVAQVISSLAWPVTVILCVLLLRRYLLDLIPLLRTVKYSDVEIRFGKEVAELAKTADTSALPAQVSEANRWEDLIVMADVRPRTAIRLAFERVADAIIEVAQNNNIPIAQGAMGMPMVIGAILLNQGAISSAQYDLLSRLRILCDQAERAAPETITSESAVEYINLALRLAASVTPHSSQNKA
jgi:hypothetical protein